MDSRQLIDAQFDRAVEIVQGLPKTGPIQTGYEEKLTMYSLYKQATVGNVKSPRPGLWDMLGRAKWDAWAKHKDLDSYEAKWLYVDALLKVLRKYSDKTVAQDLVQEIESYSGDPSNLVMSRSLASRNPGSASSGSTRSEISQPRHPLPTPPLAVHPEAASSSEEEPSDDDDNDDDDDDEAPGPMPPSHLPAHDAPSLRPQSALSASRYRTPLGGSLADMGPLGAPVVTGVYPSAQPHPGFETPSAFSSAASPPASSATGPYPLSYPYPQSMPQDPLLGGGSTPPYRGPGLHLPALPARTPYAGTGLARPPSRAPLEAAVQSVQAHLAALSERMDVLEHHILGVGGGADGTRSTGGALSPSWLGGGGRSLSSRAPGASRGDGGAEWDSDDMGMWTLLLNPLSRAVRLLRQLLAFVARKEQNGSPTLIVVRRLFLDISFMLCVLALFRAGWKKSGVRRREVRAALVVLWRAVVGGSRPPRRMVERGI